MKTLDQYADEYRTRIDAALRAHKEDGWIGTPEMCEVVAKDEFKRFLADVQIATIRSCQRAVAHNRDLPMMTLEMAVKTIQAQKALVGRQSHAPSGSP